MELIKYSLKRTLFIIPVTLLAVFLVMGDIDRVYLMEPYPGGFTSILENTASIAAICYCAFMFHQRQEIEQSLVCGVSTPKLVITRLLAIFTYTLIAMCIVLARYKLLNSIIPPAPGVPYYVPENYKLYVFASAIITILFFVAITVLLRALFSNCYFAFSVGFMLHAFMNGYSENIRKGTAPITKCFADPFISSYILSDEVPRTEKSLGLCPMEWTCNRLVFLGLSLVILFVSFLLLKREKLHRGFTD